MDLNIYGFEQLVRQRLDERRAEAAAAALREALAHRRLPLARAKRAAARLAARLRLASWRAGRVAARP
jgi:hypothetical protein